MKLISLAPYITISILFFGASSTQAEVTLKTLTKPKWKEYSTENFQIITDASDKKARVLLRDLENFRYFLSAIENRPLIDGLSPVNILAVSKKSTFKKIIPHKNVVGSFVKTTEGSYAFSNITGYSDKSDSVSRGRQTLLSSYVSYAMSNMLDAKIRPKWFSKGVASYYSTFRYSEGNITLGKIDALYGRLKDYATKDGKIKHIDVESLLLDKAIFKYKNPTEKEKRIALEFHARAVVFIHYMYSNSENKKKLFFYLDLLDRGVDKKLAFKVAFAMTFKELDDAIYNYINGDKVNSLVFSAINNRIYFPERKVSVRELGDEEKVVKLLSVLSNFSTFGFSNTRKLLLAAIEQYPNNLELKANAVLKLYDLDSQYAVVLVDEILKADPNHSSALATKGSMVYRKAKRYRDVGELDLAETMFKKSRSYYRKAAKYNPFNGRAYRGVGDIYKYKISTKGIKEGIASYDNSRFMSNWNAISSIDYDDAFLRIRAEDNVGAAEALSRYIAAVKSPWAQGYGTFLQETLRLKIFYRKPLSLNNGVYAYPDGSRYVGAVMKDMPNGKGTLTYVNGAKVTGQWNQGVLNGKVTFFASNGFVYKGEVKENALTGNAELLYPKEHETYLKSIGMFENGLRHGEHALYHKEGIVIHGAFLRGEKHGVLTYSYPSGEKKEFTYIFGSKQTELKDGVVFVGGANLNGEALGRGLCYSQNKKEPYICSASQ